VPAIFDVESFRAAERRVVVREVDRPLLVLGSTQPVAVVDARRARRRGVEVVRRRSGGGAVLLLPGAQVWADLWVPRDDPLWVAEPRASAVVAGEWWARALGLEHLAVHAGASVPAAGGETVCFAGLGPGEVHRGTRKLVGLSQWRSREGALVHGCAYRRWDPRPLVELLDLPEAARGPLAVALLGAATGLEELGAGGWDDGDLIAALPEPPTWDVVRA
jgi:lipoate---protein ligase